MDKFINKFKEGTKFVSLESSVDTSLLSDTSQMSNDLRDKKCVKFIPASGAATRMFKDLYTYLDTKEETDFTNHFFANISKFAFYKELIEEKDFNLETSQGRLDIVEALLTTELNYGNKPKALLKVHQYENKALTPIDEHVYEGEQYLPSGDLHLHFTISKEHEEMFTEYVDQIKGENVDVTYSFQKERTNTLAVDMDNKPFLLENGDPLYRAGGHGSLIDNLNDIDADIIFIKNIDNVCHRDHLNDTVVSKKKLALIGVQVKQKIDTHMTQLMNGDFNLGEIELFIRDVLHVNYKCDMTKDIAINVLNRPLRVCGVVKNQGEPGGGPFVINNGDYSDLQICETVEIDRNNKRDEEILSGSQFFNPVDLVCLVKNYQGEKFNLLNFVNEDRYFISEKTYKGRKLKALEHPGLWNGAMHNWNTLFVEVPLLTFNPVKTVNDLLKNGHVGEK